MRITDTRIGQSAIRVAETIAKKVEVAQQQPAKPDTFDHASETKELGSLLEQVNTMIGPEAMRELRNALPKAALAALDAATTLPLVPGKGLYASYREKVDKVLQMEHVGRTVLGSASHGVRSSVFASGYSRNLHPVKEMAQAVAQLSAGTPLDKVWVEDLHQVACGRPGQPVTTPYLERYISDIHSINGWIKGAWKFGDIPPSLLLQDEFGRGPGTARVDQLGYGTHMPPMAELRAMIPGYAETLKEVVQLREALKEKAFPSADEIKTSKTQLMNKELSIGEMHQEVATLLQEVQGMANFSEIKRETLVGTHKSRTEQHGESFSRDPAFGLKMDAVESHSLTLTAGLSTSQQLNLDARTFDFVVVPSLQGARTSDVEKLNFLTPVETGVAVEKLLRATRVYEAMVALEPAAPETQGLRMFMEESTFRFQAANDDHQTAGQGEGTLKMADLRQDLLKHKDAGLYPADRYDIIKDELQTGPPRPPSKLAGSRSLADL